MKPKFYILFGLLLLPLFSFCQPSENFIHRIVPRVGVDNVSGLTILNSVQTIEYFDGLGRPVQTVAKGASPNGRDIVFPIFYNNHGRQTRFYQPFEHPSQNTGHRVAFGDVHSLATAFYGQTYGDNFGFYDIELELSPLHRVLRQGGFGAEWQLGQGNETHFHEGTNTASENIVRFEWAETGIIHRGDFPTGRLILNRITDPDGNISMTFHNMDGRLMAERRILDGQNVTTYYIYDLFGRLRAVLPPLIADYAEAEPPNTAIALDNQTLRHFAFIYFYDVRGNRIESRFPGIHDYPLLVVFDLMNRPVLTQNGELRRNNQWKFQKYDAFGRPTVSGLHTTTASHASLMTAIENRIYPTENLTVLVRNYYDGYIPADFPSELAYVENSDFGARGNPMPRGQLTAAWVALTDGTDGVFTAFYYDEFNRLIQERSQNRIGGFNHRYFQLNFVGEVAAMLHEHTSTFGNFTERYAYFYDYQGRNTRVTHQMNEGQAVTIADNTFDGLGRLSAKVRVGGIASQSAYLYHVRGGLRSQHNIFFSETLFYGSENNGHTFTPVFNGNIAGISTTSRTSTTDNTNASWTYAFRYDQLDRLKQAQFFPTLGTADYSVANLSFDKMGNILRKDRTFNNALGIVNTDLLTFQYNGNQLIRIVEAGETWPYFGNQTFAPIYSNPVDINLYDRNGALIFDASHDVWIRNNIFNLPDTIWSGSDIMVFVYDALGRKVRQTAKVFCNLMQEVVKTETNYVGSAIFTNGELTYLGLVHGFWRDGEYFATINDYLGSTRIVLRTGERGTSVLGVEDIFHPDPFGVEHTLTTDYGFGSQPFRHQGMERISFGGLNFHDHGARFAFNAISRWNAMDPLMELFYSVSPYVLHMNNPVRFIDPDGRKALDLDNIYGLDEFTGRLSLTEITNNNFDQIQVGTFDARGDFTQTEGRATLNVPKGILNAPDMSTDLSRTGISVPGGMQGEGVDMVWFISSNVHREVSAWGYNDNQGRPGLRIAPWDRNTVSTARPGRYSRSDAFRGIGERRFHVHTHPIARDGSLGYGRPSPEDLAYPRHQRLSAQFFIISKHDGLTQYLPGRTTNNWFAPRANTVPASLRKYIRPIRSTRP
ncbi:MAG: DUF6443 domain-containing protein [Bacteroidales bacterium]|nr:DUF6443 domain-containing protein [Bacteroidales bacterium]